MIYFIEYNRDSLSHKMYFDVYNDHGDCVSFIARCHDEGIAKDIIHMLNTDMVTSLGGDDEAW